MHEVSVIQSLLDQVQRCSEEYCLVRVTKVIVRIGDQVGICHDSLRFAFEACSPGTVAESAEFIIENIAGRALDLQTIEGDQEETVDEN